MFRGMLDTPQDRQALRDALRGWYLARRRRLPWRDDPTPYRVWVSEIMLQQTQVATVIPYFERFIATFPTPQALAAAPLEEVLTLWSGLGYYRRARHLHAAARIVAQEHRGVLPSTPEALRRLPGIGRYTAGAIASIAFGRAAALLDGNVARVLARLTALPLQTNTSAGDKALWQLAEELVDPDDPSSHNQALMELGALVCAPKRPACPACPLEDRCAARARGDVESFPKKRRRARAKAVWAVCGLARRDDGAILLARRPEDALLGGLWELPGGELPGPSASRHDAVARHFRERLGLSVEVGPHRATVEHVFTHRRLTLDVYEVAGPLRDEPDVSWYSAWRWLDPAGPSAQPLPLSRLTDRVLAAIGSTP